MALVTTVRPWERQLFARCRRAWDFAARERGNWEPSVPSRVFDFGEAVRDAMAVYYFPGMWTWNRAIVPPLATEALVKSMRRQRDAFEAAAGELNGEQEHDWESSLEEGKALLADYYPWAAGVDDFEAVQVESLFDVIVPDPDRPASGLLAPDGGGFQYRSRIDLVVLDQRGRSWVVDHRVVTDWTSPHDLALDDQLLTRAWAWEHHFLAKATGTIHNELRVSPGPEPDAPSSKLSKFASRQETARFRRTRIERRRTEINGAGRRLAQQMTEMWKAAREPARRYPTPDRLRCGACDFRAPCRAVEEMGDAALHLDSAYRRCDRPDFEEGRLGSVWGFVPHRADSERVRQNLPPAQP